MNFMAHQYLSFGERGLQLGNLYGEIVRGKKYKIYPEEIQKGILLHREIDTYTDAHPVVMDSTRFFHEKYGKYAPVIVDVIYDYFLIKNWDKFSKTPYESFVEDCYGLFRENFYVFPHRLQYIMHHLLEYDWFRNYINIEGIEETLRGISGRSKFPNKIYESVKELKENEEELNDRFLSFFPDIINHCKNFIENLNQQPFSG